MKETWRWFGPDDPVTLHHIRQAGAKGIVTALHHIEEELPWHLLDVLRRRDEVQAAGFEWPVAESLPVGNGIKIRGGSYREAIGAWKDSLAAVAQAGIRTVCYNFMPVVDWTRTDLQWRLPSSGFALRFAAMDFAVFDLFILHRSGAESEYSDEGLRAAHARFASMTQARKEDLERTILAGLPGGSPNYDRETIRKLIAGYEGMAGVDIRNNLIEFLQEVVPVAEEVGVRLAIHPDDPPWPLFGLPRVVSTAADVRALLNACDLPANGLTFCVGSFGARADNDLPAMIQEFGPRIHFAHLRQVQREQVRREHVQPQEDGSFHEAEHLDGSSDMVKIVRALLMEEARRRRELRADHEIPMRPDHGHLLGDDIGSLTNPGYSFIGRLKGLAELRGVMRALEFTHPELSR